MMAQKLKKVFEDKYNKQIKWSGGTVHAIGLCVSAVLLSFIRVVLTPLACAIPLPPPARPPARLTAAAPVQTVRAPTLGEKRAFSQHIHLISSTDLGKVVSLLDDKCPQCIKKVVCVYVCVCARMLRYHHARLWRARVCACVCGPGGCRRH